MSELITGNQLIRNVGPIEELAIILPVTIVCAVLKVPLRVFVLVLVVLTVAASVTYLAVLVSGAPYYRIHYRWHYVYEDALPLVMSGIVFSLIQLTVFWVVRKLVTVFSRASLR